MRKYDGDKYVKNFICYNQFAVLMYGQLSNRESLRDVVLATQALAGKAYHLGFGKYASRSTLADANNKRDYRIFEEFAYQVIAEARKCRATDIFNLGGNVYAFDSTTIEICLETFKWTIYQKNQRKGGIRVHTLYDLETSIPTFFYITEARGNDMNAMDVIPYEENSFYIFDRGYNDFERLCRIIKDATFEGTILNQVKKTIAFIETQVREHTFLGQLSKKPNTWRGEKKESLPKKRKTSIQYPEPGSNRHSLAATGV